MATNVTYTSLVSDIQNYLERGTSTDQTVYEQIPRLINMAERKIMQRLDLLGERTVLNDVSGLTAGVSVLSKPDRWRVTSSLWFGASATKNTRTPLFPRSYDYLRSYWPDDSVQGVPQFYADYDLQHWLIAPTPNAIYPLEAIVYMQPPLLDASNQSNFFTTYAPNLLLYGALLEAESFLKNDERIAVWKGLFDDEAGTLMGQDLQRILDNTTERTRT